MKEELKKIKSKNEKLLKKNKMLKMEFNKIQNSLSKNKNKKNEFLISNFKNIKEQKNFIKEIVKENQGLKKKLNILEKNGRKIQLNLELKKDLYHETKKKIQDFKQFYDIKDFERNLTFKEFSEEKLKFLAEILIRENTLLKI